MLKVRFLIAGVALAALAVAPAMAQYAKVGVLTCKTSASIGLIVGSQQKVACSFVPDAGGPPDHYIGTIGRVGLDVGVRGGGVMVWGVVVPTVGVPHGALAGRYAGAAADASLGLGAGAKVLVGGSHRAITLQPISVSGQVGVNLAIGVAGLTLRATR